ncbi:MAG: STAS domain-containing protein [Planctomycetes bacterium]|nr:STAS domain-containing protein [Planctomycetota bacterium]
MEMTVVSEAPEAMVLAFNGRLDLNGVNQIDHCFKEKVAAAANVVVQMQEVTFLASLGMRMLMMAAKTLKGKKGKIVLIAPQEEVENALRMSGLDQLIPLVDSLDSAMQAIKG